MASASVIPRGQVDLVDFVDWSSVECLNQSSAHPFANALKQGYRDDDGLHLESDADEQLLIYVPFTQVVKLHSVVITGPEEEGPRTVKFFANKEHMGFSNVNDYPPNDSITLSTENLKGTTIALKYVKFQNVRSLTIFIEDNQDGTESSKVQKISLYGTTSKIVAMFKTSEASTLSENIIHRNWYSPEFPFQEAFTNIIQIYRVDTTNMKDLKKIEDH